MVDFERKEQYGISDLVRIMKLLRSPVGCPWDREQTHKSIRRNFIEETYEAAEAIDLEDSGLLREELGDVLLQVVFHSQIEEEAGRFDFDGVCDSICKKLIHRHPHIFADTVADTSDEVLRNWDEIKKNEKHQKSAAQSAKSVARSLPALMRSEKVQYRAAKAGFDYDDVSGAFNDMLSEIKELQKAIDDADNVSMHEELGDLFFSVVNVARFLSIDPEKSLSDSCDKFLARFEKVENIATERGIDMRKSDLQLLDSLWLEAKNKEL